MAHKTIDNIPQHKAAVAATFLYMQRNTKQDDNVALKFFNSLTVNSQNRCRRLVADIETSWDEKEYNEYIVIIKEEFVRLDLSK